MSELLRVENLTKRFGTVTANDRLNLEIQSGEVHALLGENGAGKSTLMNILSGLLTPDGGRVIWKGRPVVIGSPREAIALGIGMVHQHFMNVGTLTVLENVVLGLKSGLFGDMTAAEKRLRALALEFDCPINPHAQVGSLSVGEQQWVEIIKALYRDVQLLILDEPTASLTPREVEQLFRVCRAFIAQGKSVVFISHRLDEVKALGHRITVLRHGRDVATLDAKGSEASQLARLMVGQKVALKIEKKPCLPKESLLEMTDLHVVGDHSIPAVKGISLTVRRGEMVGIAGVDGNGQAELVEALLGLRKPAQGRIVFNGEDVTSLRTAELMAKGIAAIPADRHAEAIVQAFSMLDNALLGFSSARPMVARGFLQQKAVMQFTGDIIRDYQVKVSSPDLPIRNLSGGHQQRFVFGRTLRRAFDLLIAVQPTRGLDILSCDFVRRKLLDLRDAGKAVLLVSMDLDEVLMLSDRIEVIHSGKITGSVGPHASRETIGLMMSGAHS